MIPRSRVIPLVQAGGVRRTIEYRIARDRSELEKAFRLVYEMYLEWGLTRPDASRQRVSAYHLLPSTHVLVARCEAKVLATVTLVEYGELGVPINDLYGPAVEAMTARGERVAEVTGLAHSRCEEWLGVPIVERLMSLMAQLAGRQQVDRLLIAVNPQHAGFYRRIGFHVFDRVLSYPAVCGKLAVPMQLDLRTLAEDHPAAHRRFFGKPFSVDQLRPQPWSEEVYQHFRRILRSNGTADGPTRLERRCAL